MTTIEQYVPLPAEFVVEPASTLAFDNYRDVHKGVRAELFAITASAGSADPSSRSNRAALACRVTDLVELLEVHASHEDAHVLPVLETSAPALFERNASDHAVLDARVARIAERASEVPDALVGEQRARVHNLYLDLASFTGAYLAHQEFEERIVMPALLQSIGVEGSVGIHQAIVGSISPPQMAKSLGVMLPAMNLEDRVEMLAGMQASAPSQIFQGVWALANSVLSPTDSDAVASRIGLR